MNLTSEEINIRDKDIASNYDPRKRNSKHFCEKHEISRERVNKIYQRMKGDTMPAKKRFDGTLPKFYCHQKDQKKIEEIADKEDTTVSDILRKAIKEYLKNINNQ